MPWWSSFIKYVVHMVKPKLMISMRILEWWKCETKYLGRIQLY